MSKHLIVVFVFALIFATWSSIHAQSITNHPTDGSPATINPRGPLDPREGQIRDPRLEHIGMAEEWRGLAPSATASPSVVTVFDNVSAAIFNTRNGQAIDALLAFKITNYRQQKVKLKLFLVGRNSQPVSEQLLYDPPAQVFSANGARLPLSGIHFGHGENEIYKVSMSLDGNPAISFYLRADSRGLDFQRKPPVAATH
jgi:hypothetical protein